MDANLITRPANADDAPQLSSLLNEIITIGGTTAIQESYTANNFITHYIAGDNTIACIVATNSKGELLGFQSLGRHPKLDTNWGDIATFSRVGNTARGIGTALFSATKKLAIDKKLVAINATIRADNAGGLAYYEKMGFVTYHTASAVPLADGTPVDRISKKYLVTWY